MRPPLSSSSSSNRKPVLERETSSSSSRSTNSVSSSSTIQADSRHADNRPTLTRSSPNISRSSKESLKTTKQTGQRSESSNDVNMDERSQGSVLQRDAGPSPAASGPDTVSSPEDAEIARLRAAVQSRMLAKQQKVTSAASSQASSPTNTAPRRPVPGRGDSALSPMSAAFNNPLATTTSTSTESTSSSSRTVRGSASATPFAQPLRTPSYPFPYVPGTPRTWSSSFHQPFTVLSPTASQGPYGTPGDQTTTNTSTPGPTPTGFAPAGATFNSSEDPRFPTPNMYDLVLKLNAESGLDSWWSALTRVLRDNYMADRVNLALPADSNDIENVPWGQKATYNVYGQHDEASEELPAITSTNVSRPSNAPQPPLMAEYTRAPRPHILNARPSLESRHSYAGHGPPSREIAPARPALPSRTVSHAPGLFRQDTSSTNTGFSVASSDARHTSMSDPDFSSVGGEHMTSPHVAMFSTLRGLDHEFDPLIDTSGVNKVLERGKMVTLTRDYKLDQGSDTNLTASRVPAETTPTPSGNPQPRTNTDLKGSSKLSSQFRNVFSAADLGKRRGSAYEEYEQQPPSPWSQSPAPSPAIQADPEMNPFFASQDNVDDSFDPAAESPDYERLEAIEAIGVDKATTIIHLPLIHPTLSPLMPGYTEERGQDDKAGLETIERRAPIAIISIQSPAVPYPQNLTHSLKLLGPHLAACYANAYQLTSAQNQAISIRHRRGASGRNVGFAPLSIEPNNLDDLIRGEFNEGSGSFSGSITSPSDYSGRSKHSPASSLAGTPGWDPRSIAGTPAAHSHYEGPEGYFDAKKRSGSHPHRPTSTAGPSTVVTTPAKSGRSSHTDIRSAIKEGMEDDRPPSRLKTSGSIKAEKSPLRMHRENSPHKLPEFNPPQKPSLRSAMTQENYAESAERMHSVLHSYGADFSSSFQSLPAATAGARPGTIPSSVTRQASVSDPDMPPPSERLLRTIIDSLPVQIFTAAPSTGELTWVNSKFLVYRGRDSRQVLKEPWEAIHPDDKVAYMDAWKKALKTGQQLQQKIRLQRFDSNFRWFYARAAPLKDKRQNIVHWIGTNMDIHDQHVAELNSAKQQETAASEAKYRALANSSPQIVFTVNRTKGVTFCNTQWENFSGQSEKIALGLGFMEYVHPEDIVKCRLPTFDEDSGRATNVPTSLPPEPKRAFSSSQASSSSSSAETERAPTSPMHSSPVTQLPQRKLSELATTGILKVSKDADGKQSYSTEVRLRSKEGEYRWHLVRVLLADENTRIDQEETWYGTCTDINDHKTLERDLKETMDEKSRFLSNMSHEIRTPLNGITGMVNFLIDSSLSAEQMEHVNIIRASTEGLRGLINDILDLSKAEAGMIQLNLDWMYIRSLIEEVNDLTSAMALDKGLELNYLVEDDVPSHVKVDRFRVRQILLNVIGNAIKFTQTGEVFIRCKALKGESYKTDDEDMFVQFEIVDTGRGFTDKEAQYLFKRFSQIDGSSTRQHGGTGLGLVISRQLAQLHGGDMTAKGVPGKGSTFMFWIKTALPTATDKPPLPPVTPGPSPMPTMDVKVPTQIPRATNTLLLSSRAKAESPHVIAELTRSPSPYGSPSVSSAGSDPSVQTSRTSIRSTRSSASSIMPEAHFPITSPLKLEMPANGRPSRTDSGDSQVSTASDQSTIPASSIRMLSPGGSILPPMFSILVVCPLKYSREATVQHIDQTLPSNVPHQITSRGSLLECQKMIGGEDPMIFSHVVLVIQSVEEIVAFVDQLQSSPSHATTQIVIITDLAQKRKLIEQSPSTNYEKLDQDNKVRFIFKPLKPSKFGVIFDPGKEREMSTDRNRDSAQQVALTQKQVYEEMKKRIGDKGRRVLLVEDNKVNQMVLLKFLSKVGVEVETVLDGVQCTEKVFAKPHGYFSIILCDLHMPNKDGYQTCREIRKWEKQEKQLYLPIIALSANVLGDVYAKCADAGFNDYVTKPVDFKELSNVMLSFLDPADPKKPIEFMRPKKK